MYSLHVCTCHAYILTDSLDIPFFFVFFCCSYAYEIQTTYKTCVKVLSIWGCKKISLCCSSFHHSWGTMPDHTNLKPQHGRVDETTKRSIPVNHLCQRLPRCQIKVDKCCSRNLQEFTGYRGPRVFSWRTYKNRAEKRNLEGLLRLASVRVLRDPRRGS